MEFHHHPGHGAGNRDAVLRVSSGARAFPLGIREVARHSGTGDHAVCSGRRLADRAESVQRQCGVLDGICRARSPARASARCASRYAMRPALQPARGTPCFRGWAISIWAWLFSIWSLATLWTAGAFCARPCGGRAETWNALHAQAARVGLGRGRMFIAFGIVQFFAGAGFGGFGSLHRLVPAASGRRECRRSGAERVCSRAPP